MVYKGEFQAPTRHQYSILLLPEASWEHKVQTQLPFIKLLFFYYSQSTLYSQIRSAFGRLHQPTLPSACWCAIRKPQKKAADIVNTGVVNSFVTMLKKRKALPLSIQNRKWIIITILQELRRSNDRLALANGTVTVGGRLIETGAGGTANPNDLDRSPQVHLSNTGKYFAIPGFIKLPMVYYRSAIYLWNEYIKNLDELQSKTQEMLPSSFSPKNPEVINLSSRSTIQLIL